MPTANKIKAIREELGITQAELAKLSGLSEISIRKYEKGDRNPKFETLVKIAVALNIPVNNLLEHDPNTSFLITPGMVLIGADDEGNGGILVDPIEFQRVFNGIVQKVCPNRVSNLLEEFYKLSPTGQDLAIKQVKLLTKINEYKQPVSSSPKPPDDSRPHKETTKTK